MLARIAALCLSACAVLVWGGFAVGMVLWGLAAEASYAIQTGAPQQAAVAAYTASGSIIAYSVVRAVTSVLRIVGDELRAWDARVVHPGASAPAAQHESS
jgi:hypothetical protein